MRTNLIKYARAYIMTENVPNYRSLTITMGERALTSKFVHSTSNNTTAILSATDARTNKHTNRFLVLFERKNRTLKKIHSCKGTFQTDAGYWWQNVMHEHFCCKIL